MGKSTSGHVSCTNCLVYSQSHINIYNYKCRFWNTDITSLDVLIKITNIDMKLKTQVVKRYVYADT